MTTKVISCTFIGLTCELIEVQADISNGMPMFSIVGLGDTSVQESRERIRASIKNSGFKFPDAHKTVNLAPAEIKKQGSLFDLPIALSLLIASNQIKAERLGGALVIGELSLTGEIAGVSGVLAITQYAAEVGIKKIFLPSANALEAGFIPGIEIYPVTSLKELCDYCNDKGEIAIQLNKNTEDFLPPPGRGELISSIYGLEKAKRALQIAAAGGHNLMLIGPPGTGKTALGRAIIDLLPVMSHSEMLETTKIFSIAGLLDKSSPIITSRPFREVHPSSSLVSLIGGGGSHPRPGEISLAHNGVLFLDEIAEFPRRNLESLRQPLEDRQVQINRANFSLKFPSNFILMATMNPCPCGYAGSEYKKCTCSEIQITSYQQRVSGPMLDRFDLFLDVQKVNFKNFLSTNQSFAHFHQLFSQVESARKFQEQRFQNRPSVNFNGDMDVNMIKKLCVIDEDAKDLLNNAAHKMNFSNRAYLRLIKIARTIADLGSCDRIEILHVAEALQFRPSNV